MPLALRLNLIGVRSILRAPCETLGKKSILINSNPETVSTDYDESDRLYFEQLTFERVEILLILKIRMGIIVSVGGQIANNLALPLAQSGLSFAGYRSTSY